MANTLSIMYDNGENSKTTLEWEPLDTPPARSWFNMLEYTMLNPNDPPLSVTENAFCNSREEAELLWHEVKQTLVGFKSSLGKVPFGRLTETVLDNTVMFLMQMVEGGRLGNIVRTMEINKTINKLKKLLFYFTRVKEPLSGVTNTASAFGHIVHYPDPHFAIDFKPEWLEYITLDIVPGTLYAELNYADLAWHDVLRFGNVSQAFSAFKEKRFGPPSHMGSGHVIPFSQDLGGIETDLVNYFFYNREAIKHLDPSFDPVYAWKCCGRIPVAVLKTPLGERGAPDYSVLSRITNVFKVEMFEE